MSKTDPMKPSIQVLAALGSIAVHAEEGLSSAGHQFDFEAIKSSLQTPGVQEWIKAMGPLLPRKR